jgi:hypothetical protein
LIIVLNLVLQNYLSLPNNNNIIMAKMKQGTLNGPKQKSKNLIPVEDLKKVVGGMRREMTEREDERTMLQKNRNIGLPYAQDKDAAQRIKRIRQENNYYGGVADRYQSILDKSPRVMMKRDTPLPSSEGLFSKLKNWFE